MFSVLTRVVSSRLLCRFVLMFDKGCLRIWKHG